MKFRIIKTTYANNGVVYTVEEKNGFFSKWKEVTKFSNGNEVRVSFMYLYEVTEFVKELEGNYNNGKIVKTEIIKL